MLSKSYILTTLGVLCAFFAHAQGRKFSTVIHDQFYGSPLAFATVTLRNESTKDTIVGICDQTGYWERRGLAEGIYAVKVSHIGFKTHEIMMVLRQDVHAPISLEDAAQENTDEVVVLGMRVPMAGSFIKAKDLKKMNLGQDIPILLNLTPSAVATSDAGTGIGYTSLRIRGSDATRTNVTINGIPLNDAESQGVFWVNTPDFASSVQNVQIQRGVGTSVNGAGAFGATLNMETALASPQAMAEYNLSFGSFNALKNNALASTGLIKNKFKAAMRLSQIQSDGFIDKASAKLRSYYLTADYVNKGTNLQMNVFGGEERTFQAWYGVSEALLREGKRTYNPVAGYHNETDNYLQNHYQLIINQKINYRLKARLALHGTLGKGYYEQFRGNDALADYGIDTLRIGDSLITNTQLVRQRWLDNQFHGLVFNFDYKSKATQNGAYKLQMALGGGYNRYTGRHFGKIVWANFLTYNDTRQPYYDNDATKTDFNLFLKGNYQINDHLSAFADAQIRRVAYDFLGFNDLRQNVQQRVQYTFFNPKTGLIYQMGKQTFFASLARGQKEANRDEFTQSTPQSRPKAEKMWDFEIGWNTQINTENSNWQLSATFYSMEYQDQLVMTGQINDVGAYIRTNVAQSFRRGLELTLNSQIKKRWTLQANAAFSRNKIKNYIEFIDDYDLGGQRRIEHGQTDLAFSPNMVLNGQIAYMPHKKIELAWLSKYVSRQFLDNTSNANQQLDAFFVNDFRMSYKPNIKGYKGMTLSLLVNNALNHTYESNGYNYGYISGGVIRYENFYFPQAGRNYLAALSLSF